MKVDFLGREHERKARKSTVAIAVCFTLLVAGLAAIGADASYRAATRHTSVLNEAVGMLPFAQLVGLGTNPASASSDALATPDGKINILILGIGGTGHDGPELSDTIILAEIDQANNKVALVSIPRDMAYPLGNDQYEKINAVNAYAEQKDPGAGAMDTADAFSKLFNIRIDRVVRVDFQGFEDFINDLGGVDVNVPNTFTDYSFPTDDNGPNPNEWMTVSFTKGQQHMDGQRALEYARSRHGNNGEDSDFARSARQQLVMQAVLGKLLSLGTLDNPKKLMDLWTSISSHIETNLSAWDMLKLIPIAAKGSSLTISDRVMSDDPSSVLTAGNVNGAFMLFPKNGDWSQIRDIVDDPWTQPTDKFAAAQTTSGVTLELRNGTLITGLAGEMSAKLVANGYRVLSSGNATNRNYTKSEIYDLTDGEHPQDLAKLQTLLGASVSDSEASDGTVLADDGSKLVVNSSSTEFLIILGSDAANLLK